MFAAFGFMRHSVGAGVPEAVTFDAGWAPIPQDPSFTAWTNWGWPRRIQGGSGSARYDRIAVQMYVPGTNVEPLYHDNPVLANGADDSNGAVEIRLSGGSFGTAAAVTSKGTWSINADGMSLSYNPTPRASGWTAGVDEIDTEAEYRWSDDGGSSWSQGGTLKMTLVPPPVTPIRFLEDWLTPNNLWTGNDTGANAQTADCQALLADLDSNNGGTICQRNPANFFAITAKEGSTRFDINPVPQTGNGICVYATRLDKGVPSPGDNRIRVFTNPGWADTAHGPFLVYFGINHGHSGQQLAHNSTTTPWDYGFGLEFSYWAIWGSTTATPTNKAKLEAKWTEWHDHVAEAILPYRGSDCNARWCDFRGCFRGMFTQTGADSICEIWDCRGLHGETDERSRRSPTQCRTEVDNTGTFVFDVRRVLNDSRAWTHEMSGSNNATITIDNFYQSMDWGGYTGWGSGTQITNSRLRPATNASVFSGSNDQHFARHGNGTQLIQNCEVIVNNKGVWFAGALQGPSTSDILAGFIDWNSGSSNNVWHFDNCDFRVEEGMGSHTGLIQGLRVLGSGGLGIIRLTNCRFHAAADGKQFTACVANAGTGTLRVERDNQTNFGGMTAYSGSVNEILI